MDRSRCWRACRAARGRSAPLAALPSDNEVPWQRVVNSQGRISLRGDGSGHDLLQKVILKREGVRFGKTGAIPLSVFQWRPRIAGR
jgi:methylated-DNA-protein-cysteine methyltransferase-like protein